MQGRLTIIGTKDEGVYIEASLECDDILDKSYIKDVIGKLMSDNNRKEDEENV